MVSTYLDEKRKILIWDQQKHDKNLMPTIVR